MMGRSTGNTKVGHSLASSWLASYSRIEDIQVEGQTEAKASCETVPRVQFSTGANLIN